MYILVLNCGSSSLRFALIESDTTEVAVSGLAENLGYNDPKITIKWDDQITEERLTTGNHVGAVENLFRFLQDHEYSNKIEAVGHRVVHGANLFKESVIIDDTVIEGIERCSPLAPLHNPAHLIGIRAAMKVLNHLPHVAVFDTSFHQTMPPKSYLYAIPMSYYRDHSVRRYGFHGSSHRYITEKTADLLDRPLNEINLISAHLGNGASVTAVKNGKSFDTSMGLTPLEGLVMGTRSGSIDPSIFKYLSDQLNMSIDEIDKMLNTESGLLGLSELSNDCRTLQDAALKGNKGAQIALDIFVYRLAKTIASYLVPIPNLDALVFTGGIGENSDYIRNKVIEELGFMQYRMDKQANQTLVKGKEGIIATSELFGYAMVICTNEEAIIVRDTLDLVRD